VTESVRSKKFTSLIFLTALNVFLSMMSSAQTVDDCLACHSDNTLTMEKKGKTFSLFADQSLLKKSSHAKLICVACHVGFDAGNVPHKEKIEPVNCLNCHKDPASKHFFHGQMLKSKAGDPDIVASCKNCHGTHDVQRMKMKTSGMAADGTVDICATCHEQEVKHYKSSVHGKATNAGVVGAPVCISCHRSQITGLNGSADSAKVKLAQEKICLSCHLDDPGVRAQVSPSAGFIAAYGTSVHGMALEKRIGKAANCVDCHSSHDVNKGSNPDSRVNKRNIPSTCAKCHGSIAADYKYSVHGVALQKGVNSAPVCTDCHGEHTILKHSDPGSPVAAANVSSQVCAPCHGSLKLAAKYGLASNRFRSFSDSYHGLAGKAGSVEVANCASCHGVHDIKPSSDSTSRISSNNLVKTCGKCHPGANVNFTKGSVHVVATERQEDALYFVSTIYIIMIVVIVGGMIAHNLLDFIKKSKRQLMYRRGLLYRIHPGHRLYLRMSLSERIQHAMLLISFLTLVLTGFALRFPDAWWVAPVREISPRMFELRGVLHRIAAAVMVVTSLYHIYYILFVPRGKQLIRDLIPVWKDISDAIGVMKFNLGLAKEKPKFARFSYIEKSEYWALVWGTIVMAVTGIILWFDNTFLGILTKLWWDVARTVHYYEAWLATLAIIVWHFYFIIFNPDIYPLNLAFWKGTLTEEEMEEEHPLELEELKKKAMEFNEVQEKKD
jgi:cytochrome b subunit of formate dehydrogenase